ncbi:MAG TPA: response regulator [Thermoanaerobaculia bacterium]|nr:response regulator [Thermoanaerobaculia bacterium]
MPRDAMEGRGGTLTFDARRAREGGIARAEDFVRLSVSDTGAESPTRICRTSSSRCSTKQRGTGLGLSVVWQIVAAHGGRVSVDSEPGAGSTFQLFIPSTAGRLVEHEPVSADRRPRSQATRLLLVEDEEPVTTGLRWSLQAAGMDVQIVTTSAEVMPALAGFRPDVIVFDLSLPDEDGRSVYQRLSAAFLIPVIFSSGHATEAEVAQLVQPPRTTFLMKPYSTEELLETVDRLLAGQNDLS